MNYIEDNTRMPKPPAWWLQRLFDFDADLVVLPSRQRANSYILARRAKKSAGVDFSQVYETTGDTALCYTHKLIPVAMIERTQGQQWQIDNILASLRARDTWAHGGGDKHADLVDAEDAKDRKAIKDDIRNDFYNRSGDAWRSYQARTGQRTKLVYGHLHAHSATRDSASKVPSESTAGLGLVLTD